MLNQHKFAELFSAMCEMFGKEPSKALTDLYYSILRGLTDQQFEAAVKQVCSNRKYTKLPLPGELREWVFGDPEQKAIRAVEQIHQAMIQIGSYGSICFADNVLNHIVTNYGWVKLCANTNDEWKFTQKDFIKQYMALDRVRDRLTKIESIPGSFELTNSGNNHYHPSQETTMISETISGIFKETKQIEG